MPEQERQEPQAEPCERQPHPQPGGDKAKEQAGDWQGYDLATLTALFDG
jgi:hypothetical protein